MKKPFIIPLTVLSAAMILTGCGPKPDPADTELPKIPPESRNERIDIRIESDGTTDFSDGNGGIIKFGYPGVRRILRATPVGTYSVEYIHTPYFAEKDNTLDYSLEIKDDNTYSMTVTAKGVTTEHYGNWYSDRDVITLFYDEPIAQEPHNVYVSDRMYCQRLSGGKLMINDNCYTVVLTAADQNS